MTHSHQAKRPYNGSQPSITSYFPSTGTTSSNSYSIAPSPTSSRESTPMLPPTVQSNLLSVGMRVRKSVPEGYKTGSPHSGFALFSDSSAPGANSQPIANEVKKVGTRPRARELTPFCGILKVGGMMQQAWGIYSPGLQEREMEMEMEMEEEQEEEEELFPWSSQESADSVGVGYGGFGNVGGGNKRRFEDEGVQDMPVRGFGLGERVMAVPRRRGGKVPLTSGAVVFGQENSNDFGDAEFLDYGLADEVEMGGV
ncbi:hypothetical protein G7Y89_g8071 [Cudoniella acicularis]|uniref:Uncharacterized protein n=1 Tax=Cudoniella acicularis TaxID=354080 RepID=A0A8H4RKW1_9HELO|nr:hypothetical protein G7Y89_g8071 [Cudoniella acicularis]